MLKVVHKSAFSICVFALLFSIFMVNSTSATDVNYNVSVAPALTLTIPSNPIIINLDPSSKTFDSKDFTVSVGTNNKTGYTLTLSTPNDSTNLNRDTTSDGISAIMPTLDPGTYTQSSFTADKWGYKINSNTSIPSTITSGFVPFVSGNTLMESDTAVNHDEAELSLAAKIDYLQTSGSYSTTLNFNIVAHPVLDYMQNFTPAMCRTLASSSDYTVMDKRDNKEYTVRWINGNCWMTQNLTYIGNGTIDGSGNISGTMTLDPATSNVGVATNFSYGDLTAGNSYDAPRIHVGVDGQGGPTVWYNYAAASADTITGTTNTNPQVYDVCPKGWRLPSNTEASGIISSIADFNLVTGGHYNNGTINYPGYGLWWTSTYSSHGSGPGRYTLNYDGSNTPYLENRSGRQNGIYIRCILPNTMQNFTSADATAMATGETKTLQDARDGNSYTVAKLADGKVWMTTNLALAGGTKLYSETSNVPSGYSQATDTPYYTLPNSSASGFSSPTVAYVYNTTNSYYSWLAATAGGKDRSGNDVTGNGADAPYSICPKGWRLPTTGVESDASATSTTGYKKGDYYKMATAYGANLESSHQQNTSTFYNNAGPGTIPNFLISGMVDNGSVVYVNTYGYFQSATAASSVNSYYFVIISSRVDVAANDNSNSRKYGFPVRCIFE
ncbi:hypothetical protein IKG07_01530 [Candidatus Saccharibacteria bacterium]|nr:hypothetical protein [Candidatus Saccharibacteria bacterium]